MEHPAQLKFRSDDVVVLTMKTQDTEAAVADLAAVSEPDLSIICAQNGVENERLALRRFANVYAMCVMLPAVHIEPGVVIAYGDPLSGILDVGCYPQGVDDLSVQVAAHLASAGFSSRPDPSVMPKKYAKLLLSLGNALEAACGSSAQGSELELRAREEALACYLAAGIDAALAEDDAQRRDLLHVVPVLGTERDGGSSWQSLARGVGTIEADYLNGEISLLGRLHGVPTPTNTLLQRTANRMARERAEAGSLTVEELIAELNRATGGKYVA
jgi:2-dehydropantoate 2-reductase